MPEQAEKLTLELVLASMAACAKAGSDIATNAKIERRLAACDFWEANKAYVELDENAIINELNIQKIKGKSLCSKFFVFPFWPSSGNFLICLWRPMFFTDSHECEIEFLLICHNESDSIGFRLERGRAEGDRHGYPHIQTTRRFRRNPPITTSLSEQFSLSYPAFPLPSMANFGLWPIALAAAAGLAKDSSSGLPARLKELADYVGDTGLEDFDPLGATVSAAYRLLYP